MSKILNPVSGKVIKSKHIKDETFSKDMMGLGFGVIPNDTHFYAPICGEVTLINGHAYSIKCDKCGVEVLVHCGIDTVNIPDEIKSKIFSYCKKVGDKVEAGDLMLVADINYIEELRFDTTTAVIVLNESIQGKKVKLINKGKLSAEDEVLEII